MHFSEKLGEHTSVSFEYSNEPSGNQNFKNSYLHTGKKFAKYVWEPGLYWQHHKVKTYE